MRIIASPVERCKQLFTICVNAPRLEDGHARRGATFGDKTIHATIEVGRLQLVVFSECEVLPIFPIVTLPGPFPSNFEATMQRFCSGQDKRG
jgi:hypothetical protein